MPTTHPRYTVTDTGEMRAMLDAAQRRWPEVEDRRQLLLLLAAAGHRVITADEVQADARRRRQRQHQALQRAAALVDGDVLLSDAAWR